MLFLKKGMVLGERGMALEKRGMAPRHAKSGYGKHCSDSLQKCL